MIPVKIFIKLFIWIYKFKIWNQNDKKSFKI